MRFEDVRFPETPQAFSFNVYCRPESDPAPPAWPSDVRDRFNVVDAEGRSLRTWVDPPDRTADGEIRLRIDISDLHAPVELQVYDQVATRSEVSFRF